MPARPVRLAESIRWKLNFHGDQVVKAGWFSTALQLGNGFKILFHKRRQQTHPRSGTASFMWFCLPDGSHTRRHEPPVPQVAQRHLLLPARMALKQHDQVVGQDGEAQGRFAGPELFQTAGRRRRRAGE
jgi:hypothetical protein